MCRRNVCRLSVILILVASPPPAHTQQILQPDLKTISPVFDGWFKNPDGTLTLFFGYFNRNREETPIEVGPNNRVAPLPKDRRQPTNFLPQRQRHVFHVDVPSDWDGEITWTVSAPGTDHREQTTGSLKKIYEIENPSGRYAPHLHGFLPQMITARVGKPVALDGSASPANVQRGELTFRWSKNRGPAAGHVVFSFPTAMATTATFSEAGKYVLQLRIEERVNMGGSSEEHHTDALVTVMVDPK